MSFGKAKAISATTGTAGGLVYKKGTQHSFVPLVHRLTAKTNTVIYKVNRRELYCAVELPLSDYKLYGKQLAAQ